MIVVRFIQAWFIETRFLHLVIVRKVDGMLLPIDMIESTLNMRYRGSNAWSISFKREPLCLRQ